MTGHRSPAADARCAAERRSPRARRVLSDGERARIRSGREDGLSIAALAARFGLPRKVVDEVVGIGVRVVVSRKMARRQQRRAAVPT